MVVGVVTLIVWWVMKTISIIFLTVMVMIGSAFPAAADTLRIVTVALPPYGYMENENIVGLSHEVGIAIAREAGYTPKEILGPISRGIQDMASGDSDMIIMIPNPAVERHTVNLGSVVPVENIIVGRQTQPLRTLEDVRGRKLAAVRGAKYDDRISRENGMIVYPTEDYQHSLKMLMARRVDFVMGPHLGLFFTAQQLKLPRKVFGKPLVLSSVHGCLFVSKWASPEKMQRLKEAREKLMDNGTIQAFWEKYNL